jgi:O-antigen ligase
MSRSISEWLGMFGISVGGISLEEGSLFDASFYFGQIAIGLYILNKRQVNLGEFVRNNTWIAVFLLYCFVAIIWSDFPFVSFKRWIKVLGHPVMALVVLTEPDPKEALTTLLKRCAYVILPVSILFIKYYPAWGRSYSWWTGQASYVGITRNKNALGSDLLILAFFFAWYFLQVRQREKSRARRDELLFCLGFFGMIYWLFSMADSKTPLVALFIGLGVVFFAGFRWLNRRLFGTYLIAALIIIAVAELTFGVYESTLSLLGRNASLTERTFLWADLLHLDKLNIDPPSPVLGAGFESFWLGKRLDKIWEAHNWRPNQAHNGYLETYLTLGGVGVFLLLCLIAATYRKARWAFLRDLEFGRYRLGFLVAVILYNWTEASFKALHPVWTMFYLIALDYPRLMGAGVDSDDVLEAEPTEEAEVVSQEAEIAT